MKSKFAKQLDGVSFLVESEEMPGSLFGDLRPPQLVADQWLLLPPDNANWVTNNEPGLYWVARV
jgi:hypothetical protein